MYKPDTIAAISTALGEGGIAIVRISGPASLAAADSIFICRPPPPSKRISPSIIYGRVKYGREIIDEAIMLIMRAPRSYTREDVVEIQCHGGTTQAKRVLHAILSQNVRPAEPGEFTRRAFLNGRIDLLQAEAVMDLVRAQSDRSATMAMEQMSGYLTSSFRAIYDGILSVCADLEASLDFNEGELPRDFNTDVAGRLKDIVRQADVLLSTWDECHFIKDGALAVISGKTNVGKSTLLNALLQCDRAIVSPIPGTTRDIVTEQIIIDGVPIRLADTAGLREAECTIEQEGILRAKNIIEKADINIHVIDASNSNQQNDLSFFKPLNSILVLNKIDLGIKIDITKFKQYDSVYMQASAGKGVIELKKILIKKLGIPGQSLHQCSISERHRYLLNSAKSNLYDAIQILESSDESFIVAAVFKLKSALDAIAEIMGKKYYPEMLDAIFSRFCIGK